MSITDSSTALSTAWTEQTIVEFTAGTLASISDCVSEVESKLRRGTLSTSTTPTLAEVQRWLVRAKQELSEVKNFTWTRRYAYADTVAGTYRYAMPPDYNGGEVKLKDITNDRDVQLWANHIFDTRFPDPSEEDNNEPWVATIKNMELWLVPPPAGIYRLELDYQRSGADNTPTDFHWLPEIERFRCCDFAVCQAFRSLHMFEVANLYKQDWMEGLMKAKRADARRKWARMGYQCHSWLQETAARGYQQDPED